MPKVHTSSGTELDATFSLHSTTDSFAVHFESRGPNRNVDYAAGLELLLERLGQQSALITDAFVDSLEVQNLLPEQRRLTTEGLEFPIDPRSVDVRELRLALGRSMGKIGRAPNATGAGNATRRIRLTLGFPAGLPDPIDLEEKLAKGPWATERRYWAILTQRHTYLLAEAVKELTTAVVMVKDSDIRRGDRLIMWQGKSGGGKRGVVAFAEVIEGPRLLSDAANPFWVDREAARRIERRVRVRYVVPPRLPLWLGEPGSEFLSDLTVSRGQGTVFKVTPEQWEIVVDAAGGWDEPAEPEPDVPADDGHSTRSAAGRAQGRLTVEERRAIENHAMHRARAYYTNLRIPFTDRSTRKPYDLEVKRDGVTIYVEVKGTTSAGEKIVLTANEVETMRREYPNTVLFVTSDIVLDRSRRPPIASGGRDRIIEGWMPGEDSLRPLTFECTLGAEYGRDVTEGTGDHVTLATEEAT